MEAPAISIKRRILSYGVCILGKPTPSLWMTVSVYIATFLLAIFGFNLLYYYYNYNHKSHLIHYGGLVAKTEHYLSNPSQYNLIFLGDSRTYCAIQPELVDAGLGTRSYNLARFSHWFPTQYAQIMDILDAIPQDTTVVWSVGHQNFQASNGIQRTYPISMRYVPDFLTLGFDFSELVHNVTYFNPFTHFIAKRDKFREAVMHAWNQELPTWKESTPSAKVRSADNGISSNDEKRSLDQEIARLKRKYKTDSSHAVAARVDGGKITSMVLYTRKGSYLRIELDREFFRMKQQEHLLALGGALTGRKLEAAIRAVGGEEKYLNLFERILREFERRGIHLVVNEFQEAPFMYRGQKYKEAWSSFMNKKVKALVEKYGFQYISVDFDVLKDKHYFDYNHLNNSGVQVFTPLLVEKLNELRQQKVTVKTHAL